MTGWRTTVLAFLGPLALAAQPGVWEAFDTSTGELPSNRVGCMLAEPDGTLWFGTDWGLVRLEGEEWTTFQVDDSDIPSNDVTCLALDATGRLWVGTRFNGIGIWDGSAWSTFEPGEVRIPLEEVNSITHDHRGWVWISTPLGLACLTDEGWRVYDDTPESHAGNTFFLPHVKQVAVRSDDLVSVATVNAGLTYFDEEDFIYYTTFNSFFPDNSANAIALDANGDRWLACPAGGLVWHAGDFIGGPWFAYNQFTAGLPDNSMTSVFIDDADVKLVGTQTAGVLLFTDVNAWYTLGSANSGLPDDHVLSVMRAPDGTLWAGMASGGVARYAIDLAVPNAHRIGRVTIHRTDGGDIRVDGLQPQRRYHWTLFDALGRSIAAGTLVGPYATLPTAVELPAGTYTLALADDVGIPSVGRIVLQ
ncbi:MAG: two-component regulator propeller domain-containing protein [Flavobacteriales bacterium]